MANEKIHMPRFESLKERFLIQQEQQKYDRQHELQHQQHPTTTSSDKSQTDTLTSHAAPVLRKLAEKKLKRKIVGKSSLKAFIASTEHITDDPEKPAVLPVQGSVGLNYDDRKKSLKESIELLRMQLQDNRTIERDVRDENSPQPVNAPPSDKPAITPTDDKVVNSGNSNCEMNITRKNKLALQKLKKRSIFNKVDRAKSMVLASVLQRQGVDIRQAMTAIESDTIVAMKADDVIALLHTQARHLHALMLYFNMDTENEQHSVDAASDTMTVEDIHYFLDRTARNNTSQEGQRDRPGYTTSTPENSSLGDILHDTESATSEVGCTEVLMSIMSSMTVTLSAQIHKQNEASLQMRTLLQDRDNSMRSLKGLLDENVEQLSDAYVRIEQMNHRCRELEESLSYYRGVAERVVELETLLHDAEQQKRAADEALRLVVNRDRWRSASESSGHRNGTAHRRLDERKEEFDSGSEWESEEILISESRFLSSSRAFSSAPVSLNPGREHTTLRLCQSVRSLSGSSSKGCHRLTRREVSQLVAAHASQLGELTVSDWTNLYTHGHSMGSEADNAPHFTELASVVADLEAVLGKLKATKEEMLRRQLQQTLKSSDETAASSSNLCCICLDAPKSVLVLPCKHFCVCANCVRGGAGTVSRTLRQCPVCRAAVQDIMHVYS